jgi:hypothetical protein
VDSVCGSRKCLDGSMRILMAMRTPLDGEARRPVRGLAGI